MSLFIIIFILGWFFEHLLGNYTLSKNMYKELKCMLDEQNIHVGIRY